MSDLSDAIQQLAKDEKLDARRLLECAVDAADVAEVKANDDPRGARVWADISAAWSMAARVAVEREHTTTVDVARDDALQTLPDVLRDRINTPGHLGYMHDERAVFGRLIWALTMCAGWEGPITIPEDVWRQSENGGVSVKHNDDGSVLVSRVDG